MDRLRASLGTARRVAVVCNQWGDTGKGKIVDLWVDSMLKQSHKAVYCFRGIGGPNAGHTVVADGKTVVLHSLPSGVLHDAEGCRSVIGPGAVIDPRATVAELDELATLCGLDVHCLSISHMAPLILPHHILIDRVKEKTQGIGTTGRGIGPAYADLVGRNAILINDLLNPESLKEKLQAKTAELLRILGRDTDRSMVEQILANPVFGAENFFDQYMLLDTYKVFDSLLRYGNRLAQFIADTHLIVRKIVPEDQYAVLEGAQGLLLGLYNGTTKFQTCSDSSATGLIVGCGFQPRHIDRIYGVTKAPYMTRVGKGPFPTEMGGSESACYCDDVRYTRETEKSAHITLASNLRGMAKGIISHEPYSDFVIGVVVRHNGNEFGATTGRLRRTGWLDLVSLRYAVEVNGPE